MIRSTVPVFFYAGLAVFSGLLLSTSQLDAATTEYERKIVAAVLVLEAANQGEAGMSAVLHVINNRAKGNPSRAISVVARRSAFCCLNEVTSQKHPDYGPILRRAMKDRTWPRARQMVDDYVAGKIGPDITGGATHFCLYPPRSWVEQMAFTAKIGDHRFFREN